MKNCVESVPPGFFNPNFSLDDHEICQEWGIEGSEYSVLSPENAIIQEKVRYIRFFNYSFDTPKSIYQLFCSNLTLRSQFFTLSLTYFLSFFF